MSWLWGPSTNPLYEELVEKACSPLNLPYPQSENIATNLEITDMIRSKAVLPKPAMQSLKRRVASKNGRVQMYALGLIDTCIKNGGDHFLAEIASKEFVDDISGVIKSSATSAEVNVMALRLFQDWAVAFKSKPELSFLVDVYNELKNSGVKFPPTSGQTSSHLLTTTTAPTWVDSDVCMRCRSAFTFTNRKHHCRNCGLVYDQACSSHTMPLPNFGIAEEVRVCEGCWIKSGRGKEQNGPAPAVPGRTPRSKADLDADLQRAIELSLAESQPAARGNFVGSEPPLRRTGTAEDDDEQLRLAIEASLREMENARPSAPEGGEEPEYKPLPTFDLAPRETETILTFSNTMDQMAAYGERDLRRFPHAHALADQAYQLGGKLQRNAEEKATKQQMLQEIQAKLSHAVSLYGSILDGQQAYTAQKLQEQQQRQYQQHQAYLQQQQQQQQQQQPYGYGVYSPYQPLNGHSQAQPSAYPSYAPSQPVYPSPLQQIPSNPSLYPSMPSLGQQVPLQYAPQAYQPYNLQYAQHTGTSSKQHAAPPLKQQQQLPPLRQASGVYTERPVTQPSAPPPVDIASHPVSSPQATQSTLPSAPAQSASYASPTQAPSAPLATSPSAYEPDEPSWQTATGQPSAPPVQEPQQQYALAQAPQHNQAQTYPAQPYPAQHVAPSAPPAQAQAHVYNAASFPEAPAAVFPDAPAVEPQTVEKKEQQEEALLIEL